MATAAIAYLCCVIVVCAIAAPCARAQQTPSAQNSDDDNTPPANNGQDFTQPENLFQLRYLYQAAPGSSSTKGSIRTVTTDTMFLRSDYKIDLGSGTTLALRGDLPISAKNPISSDNPAGNDIYGIGDVDAQAALITQLDKRWSVGGGFRLYAPTGYEDISTGKWRIMPIIGARYMLPEISDGSYFTGWARYDVSFAGDPTKKNISNLQLAPTLNIALPNKWFFTFYPNPEIRINYGDPVTGQTGRLFLPMDVMVGRNVTEDVALSLEVSVPIIRDYPVYDFKTVTRLNMKF